MGKGHCLEPEDAWHPEAAFVVTVKVADAAVVPEMFTGVVEPKLSAGTLTAPAGLAVMDAESEMAPVNPPAGVMVSMDVLPVVAPAATETAVPLIEKVGACVTVTVAVPVFVAYTESPE